MKKLDVSEYTIKANLQKSICAVVLSDIHGEPHEYILDKVRDIKPDVILIPGDVTHSHISTPESCFAFFKDCASIAPTFFSLGNHENNSYNYVIKMAEKAGVHVLNDTFEAFEGLYIGGLTSGYIQNNELGSRGPFKRAQGHFKKTPEPNLKFVAEFEKLEGFKILLSHHPEYYPRYLKDKKTDLIISGHAHGGQWRIFGQPVFAPGQTFFPKYAQGFIDNKLIVSRGLANNGPAPRFFNNREIIFIHFY